MPPDVQKLWNRLDWSEERWNHQTDEDEKHWVQLRWNNLTDDQREAARALGYTATLFDDEEEKNIRVATGPTAKRLHKVIDRWLEKMDRFPYGIVFHIHEKYSKVLTAIGNFVIFSALTVALRMEALKRAMGVIPPVHKAKKEISRAKFVCASFYMAGIGIGLVPMLWTWLPDLHLIPDTVREALRPQTVTIMRSIYSLQYVLRFTGLILLTTIPRAQYDIDEDAQDYPKSYMIYMAALVRNSLIQPTHSLLTYKLQADLGLFHSQYVTDHREDDAWVFYLFTGTGQMFGYYCDYLFAFSYLVVLIMLMHNVGKDELFKIGQMHFSSVLALLSWGTLTLNIVKFYITYVFLKRKMCDEVGGDSVYPICKLVDFTPEAYWAQMASGLVALLYQFFMFGSWVASIRIAQDRGEVLDATILFLRRMVFGFGLLFVLACTTTLGFAGEPESNNISAMPAAQAHLVASADRGYRMFRFVYVFVGMYISFLVVIVWTAEYFIERHGAELHDTSKTTSFFDWWIGGLDGLLGRLEGIRVFGRQPAAMFYFTDESRATTTARARATQRLQAAYRAFRAARKHAALVHTPPKGNAPPIDGLPENLAAQH
jgi:hypothetical protein